MSSAYDKNAQALKALLGDDGLAARLDTTRICVVLPQTPMSRSATLLTTMLADVLGRLWPNIDFHGHGADAALSAALNAATSGGGAGDKLNVRWAPPYEIVVAVGRDAPQETPGALQVGANGWMVELGLQASCGDDPNPVGPAFAAALAAAQVFHNVFANELAGMGAAPLEQWSGDLRVLFGAQDVEVEDLYLDETHVFGVGAVTHSLVWLLENWPSMVDGILRLVDRDRYGSGNGQRYAFMRVGDEGHQKVDAVKTRLKKSHPALVVTAHATDLNSYCDERGYVLPLYRVVAGLDSEESRRHVAMKLPERAINMWTGGERLGAARYLPRCGGACLACGYLEPKNAALDEVAELHKQTGLRPDIIRELLDSARGLTQDEAAQVASKWSIAAATVAGEPLRSVMPTLCATGKLVVQPGTAGVDVPFAFASLFAGIAGFMMLLKDLKCGDAPSEGWTQHTFKGPSARMLQRLPQREECVRCDMARLSGL